MGVRMQPALVVVVLLGCAAAATTMPRSPKPLPPSGLYQPAGNIPLGYPPPRDTSDDGDNNLCQADPGTMRAAQPGCDDMR